MNHILNSSLQDEDDGYGEVKEADDDDEEDDREGVEADLDTTLHANVSPLHLRKLLRLYLD